MKNRWKQWVSTFLLVILTLNTIVSPVSVLANPQATTEQVTIGTDGTQVGGNSPLGMPALRSNLSVVACSA